MHAGYQQHLNRTAIETSPTRLEVGIPELKHSAGTRESSLIERVGDRARSGRKHERVVEEERKQAGASIECRQHHCGNFGQFACLPPQARLQCAVSALFDEAVGIFADC